MVGYSYDYNYGDYESYLYFFDFQEENSLNAEFGTAAYQTPKLLEEIKYKFKQF